ncbi:HTH-type transcriptional regulator CysL [Planctomycetes bacterium Pla163]|jgi:DNA-binding transcriptional LysR family regulator|uniref:HTH-type transcriptional regulator CysL n=1 Tax=Rohdeia mirabilis TaxID=2528008 RepID=A0A518CW23_9BACT|nr:HTH-type transcriptional regulator CysL [Planctomycetes bacterium Pla163]
MFFAAPYPPPNRALHRTVSIAAPLDPDLLTTFLAVVRAGSISGAARDLDLSQPAVTARIRRLEDGVRAPLLVRSVRGVTPTPAGEMLAERARELERLLERALDDVAAHDTALGALHIAASTTVAAHVLPSVLARFRALYRDIPVALDVGNTEEVVDAVREGRVPLGLVEGTARAAGVRLESWLDDELVPVVAPDAPFDVSTLAALTEAPILWRESGSGTRAVVARALQKAGVRRRPRATDPVIGTSSAIAGAAAAGMGVAFLSRWALRGWLESGRLRPVPGLDLAIRRTFQWALPAGALTGSAARFHRMATQNPPVPR